ncbi:unnamed protein product [Victoria cruziana]
MDRSPHARKPFGKQRNECANRASGYCMLKEQRSS